MKLNFIASICTALLLLAPQTHAIAVDIETAPEIEAAERKGGFVAAGAVVRLGDVSPVKASDRAVAVGGSITTTGHVDLPLIVAGGDVALSGSMKTLRASGGVVEIAAVVYGPADIAAGHLTATETSIFEDALNGRAGVIDFRGAARRGVDLRGGRIDFSGSAAGDVVLEGETVVIGPKARIAGALIYRSPSTAQIDPAAQIGEVRYERIAEGRAAGVLSRLLPGTDIRGRVLSAAALFVALSASGVVGALVFPGWLARAAEYGRMEPAKSLAIGVVASIGLPAAAFLLTALVVGAPIGFFLLFLFAGLAAVSLIGAGASLGHMFLGREARGAVSFTALFVGLFGVVAIAAVPIVGLPLALLLAIYGVGVLTRALFALLNAPAPPKAA